MVALSTSSAPDKVERLVFVQYLRGVAAMMVVAHHALQARAGFFNPLPNEVNFGRPGVLIFFVISGFIMMHACKNESTAAFAWRRIIRVVPLYWLLTLVFFAIIFRNDLIAGVPLRRIDELVQSLLFIPHWHSGVTTQIWPILIPGWTLNYEMFFFVIFAIGIATGHPASVSIGLLIGLVLLGWLVPINNPIWITWTNKFLLFFVAGIGLALLWKGRTFSKLIWMLPVGFALVFITALNLLPQPWVFPAFFVAAVMTLTGTLACQARFQHYSAPLLALIGDASYSIYLSHTIVMVILYKFLRLIPLEGWAQFFVTLVLSVTICAIIGIGIYRMVEQPIIRMMRSHSRKNASADQQT